MKAPRTMNKDYTMWNNLTNVQKYIRDKGDREECL